MLGSHVLPWRQTCHQTKTRERMEGAAAAVQTMHGDSFSANRVDSDPKSSTSFGDDSTEPPTLPCSRHDALVGNGAAAPTSCTSPLEMRTTTATAGLLPADTTSTATRTASPQPPLWFCPTKEKTLRTSILYASYYRIFGWINNQQAPFWPRVIETKSRQPLVFDPYGLTGRLHLLPIFGNVARVALWGGSRSGAAGGDLECFFTEEDPRNIISGVRCKHSYVLRSCFFCS